MSSGWGLTESLAGRFETIKLTHWSFAEMAAAFDFNVPHYVYFGGYPRVQGYVNDLARWNNYILKALVEPNIERDILAMQRVDKPALLKRLFEVAATSSGQILSYNKMLGQLQEAGNTTTLARYLDLLEKTGLVARLTKLQCWYRSTQGHQSKACCPQHCLDVRPIRLHLRASAGRPSFLGTLGRKRCGCTLV